MPIHIRPRKWETFQHYSNRRPPWIKLHRTLLEDRAFTSLPIASKALAPLMWLIAAEDKAGWIDADPDELVFRLRWQLPDVIAGLKPLIDAGFFECRDDGASKALARRLQGATSEREGEGENQRERSDISSLRSEISGAHAPDAQGFALTAPRVPAKPKTDERAELWSMAREVLARGGMNSDAAGKFVGGLVRTFGEILVGEAIREAHARPPAEPRAWLQARCQERRARSGSGASAIEARNMDAAAAWLDEVPQA